MSGHSPNALDKILQYTIASADALRSVATAAEIPFLGSVCSLSISIIPMIQTTRFQKDRCLHLAKEIHRFLCLLGTLCFGEKNIRSPKMLDQISHYVNTLQLFYVYLRTQHGLGRIKRIFKQSELAAQLDVCEQRLKEASNTFTMQYGVEISGVVAEFGSEMEQRHQELLELISAQSAGTTLSMQGSFFSNSSGSLSLLPAPPTIFHGREAELSDIIGTLLGESPRVAILGPGGMGKTSLATMALHHPSVVEKYTHRHFISCESATTGVDMISAIASHLCLEPSRQLYKAIIRRFKAAGSALILLDNLETPWEPVESRADVEEFLSLLADIPTLAILITMRGAERPGKVKWTRPFLPALEPLSTSAARQIFCDIVDEPDDDETATLDELLGLSGSLPLAVSLLANIASFEGYSGTLARWKVEHITLLADGFDKRSNLEKSIVLSLGSPRMASSLAAQNLLSLLALLPDGIADEDLTAANVPIPHISQCRSTLLRTSLAYMDVKGRLRALNPIREYIRKAHPPSLSVARPLLQYFQDLLKLWDSNQELPSGDLVHRLSSYIGNINELMLQDLQTEDRYECGNIGLGIIKLNTFSRTMLKGNIPLMQRLPALIEFTGNPQLRWTYACRYLKGTLPPVIREDAEALISQGVEYFNTVQCPIQDAFIFHDASAFYYMSRDTAKAAQFNDLSLSLARRTNNFQQMLIFLDTRYRLADNVMDIEKQINTIHEAYDVGSGTVAFQEYRWVAKEAAVQHALGHHRKALELCAQAKQQLTVRGLDSADIYLGVLLIQAEIHRSKSEYVEAREIYSQVASRTSPTQSPYYHAHSLSLTAHMNILTGQSEVQIHSNLDAAHSLYVALGSQRTVLCSKIRAEFYLSRGQIEKARSTLKGCMGSQYRDIDIDCAEVMADPKHRFYDVLKTLHWAAVYLAFVWKTKNRVGMFKALRRLADIFLLLDDGESALNLFNAVLKGAKEMDIHRLGAEAMLGVGDILMRRGDLHQAKKLWETARPLFIRSSQMQDASDVMVRLAELE